MKNIHKVLILCFIGFLIIFFIFNYKKIFYGNNISINKKEEIIEKILNGKLNYKANIIVRVTSNKNENIYEIMQEETEKTSYQEVISKGDIEGTKIVYTDNVLKVENSKLNLKKIYENYDPIMNDYLFLSSFTKEYMESTETSLDETDENIIITLKIENANKYIKYKELYVNKDTGIPIKMIIKDSDKQVRVCIEYTSIEIL